LDFRSSTRAVAKGNYDTKLPANVDPEQSAFLLAFINYVEGQRPRG